MIRTTTAICVLAILAGASLPPTAEAKTRAERRAESRAKQKQRQAKRQQRRHERWESVRAWAEKMRRTGKNQVHWRKLVPIAKDGTRPLTCNEMQNANQCVSSDRCGYCASTRQCLSITSRRCRKGWYEKDPTRTLDNEHPAPPTKPTVRIVRPPTKKHRLLSPGGSLKIRRLVGKQTYQRLRKLLEAVDPGTRVRNATVDQFVVQHWWNWNPKHQALYDQIGLPAPPKGFALAISGLTRGKRQTRGVRYYLGRATHARKGVHRFVGRVPFVRVSLPARAVDFKVRTAAGVVFGRDHLLRNVQNTVFKAYPAERVDLITPARRGGHRFGAVAVYLAYRRKTDRKPSYYLIEAGMAQGGPRVLYVAPDMKDIYRIASYRPTPMSSDKNVYHATLTMKGDEVVKLHIAQWTADPRTDKTARKPFHLTLVLKPTTAGDKQLERRGGEMFREAVVRMAAISEAMGQKMKALGKLQRIFAREGRHTVDWTIQPK